MGLCAFMALALPVLTIQSQAVASAMAQSIFNEPRQRKVSYLKLIAMGRRDIADSAMVAVMSNLSKDTVYRISDSEATLRIARLLATHGSNKAIEAFYNLVAFGPNPARYGELAGLFKVMKDEDGLRMLKYAMDSLGSTEHIKYRAGWLSAICKYVGPDGLWIVRGFKNDPSRQVRSLVASAPRVMKANKWRWERFTPRIPPKGYVNSKGN